MKILIVYPPSADPTRPYISLPMLKAYLNNMGFSDVVLYDANLEAFDNLTCVQQLHKAKDKIESQLLQGSQPLDESDQLYLRSLLTCSDYVIDRIADAKALLRPGHAPANLTEYRHALSIFKRAVQLASAAYHPSRFWPGGYESKYRWDDLNDLDIACGQETDNIFYDFFSTHVVPTIKKSRTEFVKIVTTFYGQMIPGFTLARLIKRKIPDIHVNLGGINVSYYTQALVRWPYADRYGDSYTFFEHEYGFEHLTFQLLDHIQNDRRPTAITNIFIPGFESAPIDPHHSVPKDLDLFPVPDFDSLPLSLYFSPEIILPLAMSRGCYWHRCVFCLHPGEHRALSPNTPVQQMERFEKKYGSKHYYFVDDSFSPAMLEGLSDLLLLKTSSYNWYCLVKPDSGLTAKLCKKLAQASCRHILLGIETASQRLQSIMDKGISTRFASEVVQCLYDLNIPMTIFAFSGFPGETMEEARETSDFLTSIRDKVSLIQYGPFFLQNYTRILSDLALYGATLEKTPTTRAGYNLGFHGPSGSITRKEAEEHVQAFWNQFYRSCDFWKVFLQKSADYTGLILLLSEKLQNEATQADQVEPQALPTTARLKLDNSVAIQNFKPGLFLLYHGRTDKLISLGSVAISLLNQLERGATAENLVKGAGSRGKDIQALLEKFWSFGFLTPARG